MTLYNKKISELSIEELKHYSSILQYIEPIKNKSLLNYTHNDVTLIRTHVIKNTFEDLYKVFDIVFGIKENDILNLKVVDFYKRYNFIIFELEKIVKLEQTFLKSKTDNLWSMAGGKELEKFGVYGIYRAIGKTFNIKPSEVKYWEWNDVFLELAFSKKESSINEVYYKLKYDSK